MGPKFDIKDFHAQVLMTGSLPMTILEKKIDDWIAATEGAEAMKLVRACAARIGRRCRCLPRSGACAGRARLGAGTPASAGRRRLPRSAEPCSSQSDEDSLRRNPLQALSRGDMRYADRLGDFLSDAISMPSARRRARELAALARIDRVGPQPGRAGRLRRLQMGSRDRSARAWKAKSSSPRSSGRSTISTAFTPISPN